MTVYNDKIRSLHLTLPLFKPFLRNYGVVVGCGHSDVLSLMYFYIPIYVPWVSPEVIHVQLLRSC